MFGKVNKMGVVTMFKDKIIKAINSVLDSRGYGEIPMGSFIEVPPSSELGDYAFPCFKLAKQIRKSPTEIANELVGEFKELLRIC